MGGLHALRSLVTNEVVTRRDARIRTSHLLLTPRFLLFL
jgi:hypothetical protein